MMSLYDEYERKWLFWLHVAIMVIAGAYIFYECLKFELFW